MSWVTGNEVPGVSYAAYRTPFGVVIPTAGRVVAYVRSGNVQEQDPPEIKNKLVTDINTALGRCRAGYGDIVVVLNGHTENVATADAWSNLVAGTKIIGLGTDEDRPTFTWTTQLSSVLFNVANVSIDNLVFECAGPGAGVPLTVDNPILISAAGCQINRCKIRAEIDANEGSTICINTTTAANGLTIANSKIYAAPGNGTIPTTLLRLVGTDAFTMVNTIIDGFTSNVNMGVMEMNTTASLGIFIDKCTFVNRTAASVVAVVGLAGSTGTVKDSDLMVLVAGGVALNAAWTNPTLMQFARVGVCEAVASNTGIGTPVSV